MKYRSSRCGAVVRRIGFPILALGLATAAGAGDAPAESPVTLQGIDAGGTGGLFASAASRPLLVNGFGVADYSFDQKTHDNSFAAGTLAVALYRSLSDSVNVFGQLTTASEPLSPFLGDDEGDGGTETEIDNLILNWRPVSGSGLDVTFGKFDSPLAIERDDAPLNFQGTESFTLGFARPVKFTGLAVHEAFSSTFEGWAIVANGWDLASDNNHAKTGALYGLWSPSLAAHLGLGVIYGAERDDGSGDARTTAVGTLLFQPAASWVWGGESVAGEEPGAVEEGVTAKWFAQTLFAHHRFGDHWAGTLRAEVLDDRDGARTGTPQTLRSLTLSPQYLVGGGFYGVFRYLDRTSLRLPGLAVRLDLRYDHSDAEAFRGAAEDAGTRDHLSATLQTVFLF
jgi:Putative beta-barrel porin-2, OmpL-like. bbp2